MRAGDQAPVVLRVVEIYRQLVAGKYLSVEVRALGIKNGASTAKRVDVDAFVVLR